MKVNYRGTLDNGTEFDSSYKRNEPVSFPLNHVIPCWTEGVQKMKVGGKAQLVCPASIAYGPEGRPPVIPGGATLTFEIELLGIGPFLARGADTRVCRADTYLGACVRQRVIPTWLNSQAYSKA